MAKKEQMDIPVADLRAKIDGKIRFGHSFNGYNQTHVNNYIAELNGLHDQENKKASEAYLTLERRCQELEGQNNLLNEKVSQRESELMRIEDETEAQSKELIQIKEQLNSWQKEHDPEIINKLNEENTRLSAAYDMCNCEFESQKKQIQTLAKQNMELAHNLAESDRNLTQYKQDHRQKLTILKALENNSLSELQTKLDGCLSFLTGLSEKNKQEWTNLIED